jgi:hypothetical protein
LHGLLPSHLAQYPAFRRAVPNARLWILATALGWGLGLPFDMIGASLPGVGDSMLRVVAFGAGFGLTAGVVVAIPTGLLILRWMRRKYPSTNESTDNDGSSTRVSRQG